MSEFIYFLHRDGIIEFNRTTGSRREMCKPMPLPDLPMPPKELFYYARMMQDLEEMITGVPPETKP